jgi:hypothetical protein
MEQGDPIPEHHLLAAEYDPHNETWCRLLETMHVLDQTAYLAW